MDQRLGRDLKNASLRQATRLRPLLGSVVGITEVGIEFCSKRWSALDEDAIYFDITVFLDELFLVREVGIESLI